MSSGTVSSSRYRMTPQGTARGTFLIPYVTGSQLLRNGSSDSRLKKSKKRVFARLSNRRSHPPKSKPMNFVMAVTCPPPSFRLLQETNGHGKRSGQAHALYRNL